MMLARIVELGQANQVSTMTTSAAASSFEEVVSRVAADGERVVLERDGVPIVALVSVEDLDMIEQLEDDIDVREATKIQLEARAAGEEPVSAEDVRRELGL